MSTQFSPVLKTRYEIDRTTVSAGQFLAASDTGECFVDLAGGRVQIRDVVQVASASALPLVPLAKLYYAQQENMLYYPVYEDNELGWAEVGPDISGKQDAPASAGSVGQVLKKTANGTEWANESGGGSSPVPVRQNSTAYFLSDRVEYPGKAGYVLFCKKAGTSAASAPSLPAPVISGTSTLTDGTVVWRLYDATNPKPPVPVRMSLAAYTAGDRVLYPDKAGYIMICTTAGTTSPTVPSFPASVTSGTTTLSDGSAVWTIYDETAPEIGTVVGLSSALSRKMGNISGTPGNVVVCSNGAGGGVSDSGVSLYSGLSLRKGLNSYSPGARVYYPGKAGFILVCTSQAPGTTDNSLPTWPSSVTPGITTISDGTVTWTIYDATAPNMAAVGGLSSALSAKAGKSDVSLMKRASTYSVGARAIYPGKTGYILICTKAGLTTSSFPAWPSSVISGTTFLVDGEVRWTIYDLTLSSIPIGSIFMYPLTTPPNGAYLLNGQTISNCQSLYPGFWSWLNNAVTAGTVRTLNLADWANEVSVYGQCGAFVISGSAVRLPLINGFIQGLGTGTDKGATVAPGLPNITGNAKNYSTLSGGGWNGGALYGGSAVNADIQILGGSASYKRVQINLDASRANAIYGNSDTVQPPAIKYNYCIQVFNAATNLSIQESAQIATTLQGKADVNLGNLSAHTAIDANCPVDYIIKRGTGTNTWYRIWKSGWLEQGGVWTAANTGAVTVNFGVAFASTDYCILKNRGSNDTGGTSNRTIGFYSCTTSSATTYSCAAGNSWYACGQGDSTDIAALLA